MDVATDTDSGYKHSYRYIIDQEMDLNNRSRSGLERKKYVFSAS